MSLRFSVFDDSALPYKLKQPYREPLTGPSCHPFIPDILGFLDKWCDLAFWPQPQLQGISESAQDFDVDTLRFAHFRELWKSSGLFRWPQSRPSDVDSVEYTQSLFRILTGLLHLHESIPFRVGILYSLFSVFQCQDAMSPSPIRVTPSACMELESLQDDLEKHALADALAITRHLRHHNAFLVTAMVRHRELQTILQLRRRPVQLTSTSLGVSSAVDSAMSLQVSTFDPRLVSLVKEAVGSSEAVSRAIDEAVAMTAFRQSEREQYYRELLEAPPSKKTRKGAASASGTANG